MRLFLISIVVLYFCGFMAVAQDVAEARSYRPYTGEATYSVADYGWEEYEQASKVKTMKRKVGWRSSTEGRRGIEKEFRDNCGVKASRSTNSPKVYNVDSFRLGYVKGMEDFINVDRQKPEPHVIFSISIKGCDNVEKDIGYLVFYEISGRLYSSRKLPPTGYSIIREDELSRLIAHFNKFGEAMSKARKISREERDAANEAARAKRELTTQLKAELWRNNIEVGIRSSEGLVLQLRPPLAEVQKCKEYVYRARLDKRECVKADDIWVRIDELGPP